MHRHSVPTSILCKHTNALLCVNLASFSSSTPHADTFDLGGQASNKTETRQSNVRCCCVCVCKVVQVRGLIYARYVHLPTLLSWQDRSNARTNFLRRRLEDGHRPDRSWHPKVRSIRVMQLTPYVHVHTAHKQCTPECTQEIDAHCHQIRHRVAEAPGRVQESPGGRLIEGAWVLGFWAINCVRLLA